jgi:hypothetical protein
MKNFLIAPLLVLCGCLTAAGTTLSQTYSSQSISLTLATAGKVSVPANVAATTIGTTFQNFTMSELVNYKARTTQTGSATLNLLGSSYLALGGTTYTCSGATLGSACSGTQTVSGTSGTVVVTVGPSSCVGAGCASSSPATLTLNFIMINSPTYPTGSYSAAMTFSWTLI